ncbi:MAG TPA: LysR family transcriptional regulator [Alphaproteobacteria bacterium]|jgi:DNA-binding transcriptional LysR family regulator
MHSVNEMVAFARVVEAQSFSGAAERLGTSKSSVSAQVRRLEARMGVRLLHRTTRRLSLTEAGAACYRHCARLLEEAEAAEQAAGAFHAEPRGTLRISAPDTFGWMHVAPALGAFAARYPGVTIDLSLTSKHVDLIDERLDLAIRIGALPDSSHVTRRLALSRLVICATPEYLARHGEPRDPGELAQHNCLRFAPLGWGMEWRLRGANGPLRVPIGGSFVTNSGEVLRAAALAGLGLGVMPSWMIGDALRAGALVPTLERWAPPPAPIQAIYPGNRLTASKVRVFVDHLAKHFGPKPYWERGLKLG